MREIKFRVWDITKKKMVYSDCQKSADEMGLEIGERIMAGFMAFYWGVHDLEQFTGLTDKNGKEIFEGDVCKKDVMKYVVIFKNGAFRGKALYYDYGDDFNHTELYSFVGLEIIGNIHENPELLND